MADLLADLSDVDDQAPAGALVALPKPTPKQPSARYGAAREPPGNRQGATREPPGNRQGTAREPPGNRQGTAGTARGP